LLLLLFFSCFVLSLLLLLSLFHCLTIFSAANCRYCCCCCCYRDCYYSVTKQHLTMMHFLPTLRLGAAPHELHTGRGILSGNQKCNLPQQQQTTTTTTSNNKQQQQQTTNNNALLYKTRNLPLSAPLRGRGSHRVSIICNLHRQPSHHNT